MLRFVAVLSPGLYTPMFLFSNDDIETLTVSELTFPPLYVYFLSAVVTLIPDFLHSSNTPFRQEVAAMANRIIGLEENYILRL